MEIIKAVFFDYDGVMTLDKSGSESVCNYISKNMCIDYNILYHEYRKYNIELSLGKITHKEIWKQLCKNINLDIPISVLYDSFTNTPIDEKMHEFVLKIKNQKIKTGLITDNKVDRVEYINKKFDLNKYFDIIAVSAELGCTKETDKLFVKSLERTGIKPEESIFIDNQAQNLVIPKSIGMKTIYYNDRERNMIELEKAIRNYGVNV